MSLEDFVTRQSRPDTPRGFRVLSPSVHQFMSLLSLCMVYTVSLEAPTPSMNQSFPSRNLPELTAYADVLKHHKSVICTARYHLTLQASTTIHI